MKFRQAQARDAEKGTEQNFLNSFLADDLCRIERAMRDADIGAGLAAYLSDTRDIPADQRVNVQDAREAVVSGVAPQRIPGGR